MGLIGTADVDRDQFDTHGVLSVVATPHGGIDLRQSFVHKQRSTHFDFE
ncbi:hypothetical protein PAMC26510_06280 [Caballeronia sordidicola]|uniref:Uncharacterized protein n=1 Tax=Caballeronia sordidicola TaxID=196367 RepID=A0A242N6L4_CABSO|nr:hypothetical protein PAMC26510_06280 [Caballeronia sordidicola]